MASSVNRTAQEPKSQGLVAEQLFRDFERMSPADQEALAKMAELLAKKNEEPGDGNASGAYAG